MEFRHILKRLRQDAKLSQEKLADICGYSGQSRIGNYESGTREPPLAELPVLARALGVSVGTFFGEGGLPSQSVRLAPNMLATTAHGLLQRARRAGKKYTVEDIERDPEAFIEAYQLVVDMADVPDRENVASIGTGGSHNHVGGRSEGVPSSGTPKRKVGTVRRRKA